MPVGAARRTQSLPSKYMIPSSSMGEYEAGRRKTLPSKPAGGGLFPLDEEGTYGAPPKGPAKPPPPAPKRERKPKVYSSYSVDSKCDIHAKKLAKVEKQREREMEEQRAARRRKSYNSAKRTSASPSRGSSEGRSSKSPEPYQQNGGMRKKSSGDHGGRKMTPTAGGTGYSSSSYQKSASASRYSTSSTSSFRGIRESSKEDNGDDDYSYSENRKHSGYSKYADNGLTGGMSGMSLDGLRKPKIDSWDSMGILGLTTKIWNDTKKRQETFMTSTGHFLREESSTYIM